MRDIDKCFEYKPKSGYPHSRPIKYLRLGAWPCDPITDSTMLSMNSLELSANSITDNRTCLGSPQALCHYTEHMWGQRTSKMQSCVS